MKKIKRKFQSIKWFIQRGKRGYSDKDTWSLDDYIMTILVGGINELIKRELGHPVSYDSIEEWHEVLNEIKTLAENYDELAWKQEEYERLFELLTVNFSGLWD